MDIASSGGEAATLPSVQKTTSTGRRTTPRSSPAAPLFATTPLRTDQNINNKMVTTTPPPSFSRLLSLNSPEWMQALLGSLSAMTYGAVHPFYALTVGGMIASFFLQDHDKMRSEIRAYSITFCLLCLMSIILNLSQHYNFAYMGEHLTNRVRVMTLSKILTFEPSWFDQEENSSAALCSRMSHEVSMVKSLVADRLSLLVQTTSSVTIAMVMGLTVAWKLALVMIAVQPLTILCFYTRKVLLSAMSSNYTGSQTRSTQIAAEAVYNHRIVTSYNCVEKVVDLFDEAQEEPRKQGKKKAWLAGLGIGLAQCLTFMSWALDFWYGGKLVQRGEISAGDVFKTFYILISTGKVIADAGSMTSDLAKGSAAVASVFKILDRPSEIPAFATVEYCPLSSPLALQSSSSSSETTKTKSRTRLTGQIELRRVDFFYPTRPETAILNQFSLEVRAGTSIGLVGRSGCGKSTVIALMQRLYDVVNGAVTVDGVDIRGLDVVWYRKQLAIVSQEPVLFGGSLRDNIVFGKPDATEDEVVRAARAANAHEFICGLKDGYDTECGERGVQLSGGQRQRIAIARAIIRNPTILLLDEATSALDLESERVVQEALERVMVNRTTVVVAHRLNTIKNLDCIAYVEDGKVVEKGSYSELKQKRGAFFNLARLQSE